MAFLTIQARSQLVATHGNGFRLFRVVFGLFGFATTGRNQWQMRRPRKAPKTSENRCDQLPPVA
jgi:hypothetical protein